MIPVQIRYRIDKNAVEAVKKELGQLPEIFALEFDSASGVLSVTFNNAVVPEDAVRSVIEQHAPGAERA